MRVFFTLLACLLLAACQTTTDEQNASLTIGKPYAPAREPRVQVHDARVVYAFNDVRISLNKPATWEAHGTEYGVVIAERMGSVATRGQLEGLMAYVFLTPLEDYPLSGGDLSARTVLDLLITDPDYVGEARVNGAFAFDWGDQDAAYYLLRDTQQNILTVLVAVLLPDQSALLTATLSAPEDQGDRLRAALPDLLGDLTFNETVFPRAPLEALPDPLDFPG